MLNNLSIDRLPLVTISSFILITSIILGAMLGHFVPVTGEWLGNRVDYTLLTLVALLFFGARFDALFIIAKRLDFLAIALLANFVVVPFIGYGIASLFLSAHPLFAVGLVIYFMAPCTDWFLSFTRLSGGNVALGTVLIPINMTVQLLLFPFYLDWFTQNSVQVEAGLISSTLLQWFLLPFLVAIALHQCLQRLLKPILFGRILDKADKTTLWVTAALIMQIFAGNISMIIAHHNVLFLVLIAVFAFFLLTFLLSEALSYFFSLRYPERALLTMTTAARNAPLMLAVTVAVLPDQPLIYAALVIGMLVEMPHLTILRQLLLRKRQRLRKVKTCNI